MTNKKPFKLQRACYTQATFLAMIRKVESRSTFFATRNAAIAVAKWGVTREFFSQLATQRLLRCKLQENLLRVTWPLLNFDLTFNGEGSASARWMTCLGFGYAAKSEFRQNFAKLAKILRLLQKYSKTNSANL